MTGKHIGGYNRINEDEMNKLSYLHSKYILKPDTEKKIINTNKGFGNDLSIEQIIDIAKKSKNGLRFTTLYEGDWSQFTHHNQKRTSHSVTT